MRKVERWEGGLVRVDSRGRTVFVIERMVAGRRYCVSTRCHTVRAALVQLQRFEADPSAYTPGGSVGDGLTMTADLVESFYRWQVEVKGNGHRHAWATAKRLREWLVDFDGADLRTLKLGDLHDILERRKTMRPHRIIALKSFFSWLRTVRGILKSADDVTLELPVPQAQPEKHRRRKAVEWWRVQKAAEHLDGAHRDCLTLLTATAWHVTELMRFVRGGEIIQPAGGPLAVLVVRHKGGELHRTPIAHAEHLESAQRLRARGEVPRRLNVAIYAACKAAKVSPFGLGVLRHSVLTWAIEDGAPIQRVAEFAGHKDARTTRRFYVDVAHPTASVPVRLLGRKLSS